MRIFFSVVGLSIAALFVLNLVNPSWVDLSSHLRADLSADHDNLFNHYISTGKQVIGHYEICREDMVFMSRYRVRYDSELIDGIGLVSDDYSKILKSLLSPSERYFIGFAGKFTEVPAAQMTGSEWSNCMKVKL